MCKTKIQSLKKYVNEILSYLSDPIIYAIMGVALIFAFIAVGILLTIYLASSIPVTESILGLLNVSFSVILITITAIYVFFTGQIVEQTNKNNKILFIEKRLEKLYYPLEDILQNPIVRNPVGYIVEEIDLNKIDNIIPYQYLASKNIEELLNDFIKTAFNERKSLDNNYVLYLIVTEEIKTMVNDDIKTYKRELKKLIRHRD